MDARSLITVKPNPKIPQFGPGDTVRVNFRVREGERERIQAFQGVVIKRRGGASPGASFSVRRVTYAIGVERTFPLYSPLIESVEVIRRGDVRRAKLYFLRSLSGRAARIKEKSRYGKAPREVSNQAPEEIETTAELEIPEVPETSEEPETPA